MARNYPIGRTLFLVLLGLLGLGLLPEGVWFGWQGESMAIMVLVSGTTLMGTAWWLLFHAPLNTERVAPPYSGADCTLGHKVDSGAVRTPKHWDLFSEGWAPIAATADELRIALAGIGLQRLSGVTWEAAAGAKEWADLGIFLVLCLHRDDGKPARDQSWLDHVHGIYLSCDEANEAVVVDFSNSEDWKPFVVQVMLGDVVKFQEVRSHLVRVIKFELDKVPVESLPGEPVELRSVLPNRKPKAWLGAGGQHVVLFEDEPGVMDGPLGSTESPFGAFKTAMGTGLFDDTGTVLAAPTFEDIKPVGGSLRVARKGGLWGFIDRTGAWQIEPRFLDAWIFGKDDDDCTRARSANGWGLIDRRGEWLVPDRYAEIGDIRQVEINYESLSPTLGNEPHRVASVRKIENGPWGGVKLDTCNSTRGEELLDFVCATNDEVFQRLASRTMSITDVIGKRLLNIYGYQQMNIEDQLDDKSVWWLEFEGKLWVTVAHVIAPAWASPTFQLQFRVFRAGRLDLKEGSPPFVTNPTEVRAIQGMLLLRILPTVGDQLADKELGLGFGTEGTPTNVLHIGYLDEWRNDRWSGMGVRVTAYADE